MKKIYSFLTAILLSSQIQAQNISLSEEEIASPRFFDGAKCIENIISTDSGAFFKAKYNHEECILYKEKDSFNIVKFISSRKGLGEFVVANKGNIVYFVDDFKGQKDIFRLNRSKTLLENITKTKDKDEINPRVDSSGNILSYLSEFNGKADIFLYNFINKSMKQLTDDNIIEKHLDLSLDGINLVYSYYDNSKYFVDIINLNTGLKKEVVSSDGILYFPQITSSGKVFYSTVFKNNMYIYYKSFLDNFTKNNFVYKTSDVINSFKINKDSEMYILLRRGSKRSYLELCSLKDGSLEPTDFIFRKDFKFLNASSISMPSFNGSEFYFDYNTFNIKKLGN